MSPKIESIGDVRAHIADISSVLDPSSRYVSELLDIVDASKDLIDFERRLKTGCRGRRFSGPTIFDAMNLADKILANLITNETQIYRFEDAEAKEILSVMRRIDNSHNRMGKGPVSILVAPCSHGAEAFTVSSLAAVHDVSVEIDAWDIQHVCIESARQGILATGIPHEHLKQPAIVTQEVLEPIQFDVVNLIEWSRNRSPKTWDIVQCRNFLGYFITSEARKILTALAQAVNPGGYLLLDPFIFQKLHRLDDFLECKGFRRRSESGWVKPPS